MATVPQEKSQRQEILRCAVSYNRYGAYCVPLSSAHRPAATMILRGDVYEPNTIEFIRSTCGDGDIVHAGTYFGDFLPGLAQACQGKVWAFEPNLENYRCAQITLLLNGITNVELFRAGVGAGRESRSLLTADPDGLARGGSSRILSDEASPSGQVEMVPMVSIDDTIPSGRRVSLIHLDVEGYEQPALAGALSTIQRSRPVIVVEVLAESTLLSSDWFAHEILQLGYRMTGTIHGNAVFFPEQRHDGVA